MPMIIHRKTPQSDTKVAVQRVIWISIGSLCVLVLLVLLAKLSRDPKLIEPMTRQIVFMGCGFVMLLATAFPFKANREEVSAFRKKVIITHLVKMLVMVAAGIACFALLGSKGDLISMAVVAGCAALLTVGAVLPQAILKLKQGTEGR